MRVLFRGEYRGSRHLEVLLDPASPFDRKVLSSVRRARSQLLLVRLLLLLAVHRLLVWWGATDVGDEPEGLRFFVLLLFFSLFSLGTGALGEWGIRRWLPSEMARLGADPFRNARIEYPPRP